jgi:hypothetical protein
VHKRLGICLLATFIGMVWVLPPSSYPASVSTLTKGLIGEQDIEHYDGVDDTFNRVVTSGNSIILNTVGGEVDALMVGGNGVNRTDTTINTVLTTIGTTRKRMVLIRPGTWTISANRDWSAYTNITFHILPGALLSHGAFTLNIPNPVAEPVQWLTGAGAVTFSGKPRVVYPEWFGAVGDGVTDDATVLQTAINSMSSGTLRGLNKTYYLTTGLVWKTGVNAFWENTTLKGANGIKIIDISSCSNFSFFGKLNVQGATVGATNATYGIYGDVIANAYFQHVYGVDVPMVMLMVSISDSQIDNVGGLRVKGKYQGVADTAGSILAVNIATRLTVGKVYGNLIYKCATYLGTAGAGINTNITIGSINVVLDPDSPLASAFGARSTIGATVGEIISENGYRSVSYQRESGETDDVFKIERISVGRLIAKNVNATGGIAVYISSEEATKTVDDIIFGDIIVDGVYANGVVFKNCKRVKVGSAFVKTTTTGYGIETITSDDVYFGSSNIVDSANHSVYLYQSTNVKFGHLRVLRGGYTSLNIDGSSFLTVDIFESDTTGTNAIYSDNTCSNLAFGKVIIKDPVAQAFIFNDSSYISLAFVDLNAPITGTGFISCTYISIGQMIIRAGAGLVFVTSSDISVTSIQLVDITSHGVKFETCTRGHVGYVSGVNVGTGGSADVVYVESDSSGITIGDVVAYSNVVGPLVGHRYAVDVQGATNTAAVMNISSTGHTSGIYLYRGNAFSAVKNGQLFYPRTSVSPAAGTWEAGDKVYYPDPTASGYVGAVCTSPTTPPGTWKGFGALAP